MNAASSMINIDRAAERPAVPDDDTALICDPFLRRNDRRLSSTHGTFNQLGRLSFAKRTRVTISLEVSCVILIHKMFLSLLKTINQRLYALLSVVIPN